MLYRKQTTSLPSWITAGVAVAALILGFGAGRLSAPKPSLERVLEPAALHLRQAGGALDIVALEYARARAGEAASQAASLNAVREARAQGTQAGPLAQLYPAQVQQLDTAFAQLERAVQQQRPEAEVTQSLERVRAQLGQFNLDRLMP